MKSTTPRAAQKDLATDCCRGSARKATARPQNGTSRTVEQMAAAATAESDNLTLNMRAGSWDEVTVTATKASSLWERMKQAAAWAAAIMIWQQPGWDNLQIQNVNDTSNENIRSSCRP